ncbi:Ku protein [Streptomyces sp. NPDC058434]|uniref:non-homologous end joining protein Ku n=1 Tax=Streptomyces sp. NPDC058434 TaxID=3346498 RepID=UPI0036548003
MPRPVWSGAISFGLVTIPIKMLPATEDRSVRFRSVHLEDMGRVRNKKICELEGREVSSGEIGKGYELSGGDTVTITDEELDAIPLPTAKAIDIQAFVPAESIDPVRVADGYFLQADGPVAAKPYVLLRKALERSSKVAVAKLAFHGRERLGLLRVLEDAIVIHMMRWPDEIRNPSGLAPKPMDLDEQELEGALSLLDTMSSEAMPDLHDEYRESLEAVIAAKSEGRAPELPQPAAEPSGQVVDLMAALNASVAKAREQRGEPATVHDMPMKRAAKKSAAKKSAAQKSAAQKSAAQKAGAKKAAKTTASKKTTAKKSTGRKPRSA